MLNFDKFPSGSQKNRYSGHDKTEAVLLRLDWLEEPERTFMEAHFVHHVPIRALAGMTGWTEKTVSLRLRGLSKRLAQSDYVHLVRHRDWFNEQDFEVAYDHFMLNLGYRRIAVKRRLSLYEVRRRIERIRSCVTSASGMDGLPRRCGNG